LTGGLLLFILAMPLIPSIVFPFDSVKDFLSSVGAARENDRVRLEEQCTPVLDSLMNDPCVAAVPNSLADTIESLVEQYGDQALKSIAQYCLNLWTVRHGEELARMAQQQKPCVAGACAIAADHAILSTATGLIIDVGAFGSSDDWQRMIRSEISGALLQSFEEEGIALSDVLQEDVLQEDA